MPPPSTQTLNSTTDLPAEFPHPSHADENHSPPSTHVPSSQPYYSIHATITHNIEPATMQRKAKSNPRSRAAAKATGYCPRKPQPNKRSNAIRKDVIMIILL